MKTTSISRFNNVNNAFHTRSIQLLTLKYFETFQKFPNFMYPVRLKGSSFAIAFVINSESFWRLKHAFSCSLILLFLLLVSCCSSNSVSSVQFWWRWLMTHRVNRKEQTRNPCYHTIHMARIMRHYRSKQSIWLYMCWNTIPKIYNIKKISI